MRYEHDHEKDIVYFGQTNFRNQMRRFGIKTDDRRRHMYIVGKTGMGKTVLLENMILADIYAGHGCAYIDPHGDTVQKILDYIPSWRINDVVYFNPADGDFPVAFNMLEKTEGWENVKDYNAKVMYGLLSIFKKVWENVWSARMEYILQYTILALLDTPGTTLLGINRMLSDKEYRTEIVQNVKDPMVQAFWLKEFAQYDVKFAAEASAPIQNKVGQFLASTMMRNIVAQSKSSFNFREVMDGQRILLINLSKGQIGEDAMRILGGMLITKIYMSAMERVNIRDENERVDFYLYVDEFQNFATESFADILSEARKYRLNLIIAHQYIAQLDSMTSTAVRDAVFGNVGTMITFRIGAKDAEFLESEFMPRFTPEDLINLAKWNIYLKLMIDGVSSQPFSAATLPPIGQRTGSEEKVIEQSRERFGGNRKMIEEHVMTWSGFNPDLDVGEAFAKVAAEKKEAKKARFAHEYTCARCGKLFTLPVELDKSRPIYCDDCHALMVEERKKKGSSKPPQGKQYPPEPPKISASEMVVIPTPGEALLESLPPRPEAPPAPEALVADRTELKSTPNDGHTHKLVPVVPPAPRPQPAPSIPRSAASAPTVPTAEGQPAKKKRRRKKKSSGLGSSMSPIPVPVPKPAQDPVAAAMSAGPVPTPVAPGERISFDS
ncbi:MAG: type IV secretion system DNA-binding domain-containing protein [Patescibacteria group bacterium]